MNNLREGSKLPSLLTSFLAYQKTGNYRRYKVAGRLLCLQVKPLASGTCSYPLIVITVSWLPGSYMPPYNHGTWAVVVGIGSAKNIFWERVDDRSRPGYAEPKQVGEKICCSGNVLGFLPDTILSILIFIMRSPGSAGGHMVYRPVSSRWGPYCLKQWCYL